MMMMMMMMMNRTKLIWLLLLLVFLCMVVDKGWSQSEDCPTFALFLNQTETGREMGSKKEWKVSIRHICVTCDISEVNVTCPQLDKSLTKVNADIISKMPDGNCQLLGGRPFDTDARFSFTYVWDRIDFQPLQFSTFCT